MTYRLKETIGDATLYLGDCLDVLRDLPDNSVDAIVTDPPYGLGFMGKHWDHGVPSGEVWEQCLRVLKPGGHLLAFAGTRTQHRMAVNIEDAGFEIRDMIAWVYGSGFPKSLDVSKAIDKAAGAEREIVGKVAGMGKQNPEWNGTAQGRAENSFKPEYNATAPATPQAQQWAGWGTALKPALEPITVARKPFKGTVAANVLEHGTGAINVDGCRIDGKPPSVPQPAFNSPTGRTYGMKTGEGRNGEMSQARGRWPANLIHDGSEEVVGLFPVTGPSKAAPRGGTNPNPMDWGNGRTDGSIVKGHNDNGGSAARFFYCAKASKKDRGADNKHPTVKPTDLMRYLVRLVTPPGGTVLDPFMGSGSTGKACALEGFGFIGIEREPEYHQIAMCRVNLDKIYSDPKVIREFYTEPMSDQFNLL